MNTFKHFPVLQTALEPRSTGGAGGNRLEYLASQRSLAAEPVALCVDADMSIRPALREALSGCDIVFASGGYDAVRNVNARAFDLYVLEYWLPDWSGLSLCRAIKKQDPNAPICFCTAAPSPDNRRRAERAGAAAYFLKPLDTDLMHDEVSRLLQLKARRNHGAEDAAFAVLQQELATRVAALPGGQITAQVEQALRRSIRNKAREAFLASGGTLSAFERSWEHLWQEALQNSEHAIEPRATSGAYG